MECSVMSGHFLGASFDIHGGGEDLLFPHHENERAQSIAANGGRFARYWIHNGFVTVESEKMSKSLGNFLTIRDALQAYHPEVLRLFLLSKHYRSPLDFSKSAILAAQAGLVRIYRTLQRLDQSIGPDGVEDESSLHSSMAASEKDSFLDQFVQTMDDDLNTAGAIGLVFEKVKEMNKIMDSPLDESNRATLASDRRHLYLISAVLGFLHEKPEAFFDALASSAQGTDPEEIEKLIVERNAARKTKDWARADALRQRLKDMGIVLEDSPKGTSWRYDLSVSSKQ
jgi:cysteinyl-tRNA synthetase